MVRPFAQVDVFSEQPFCGNPVAVVVDAAGLDEAAMQRFAVWTNLSETTFLLPPTDAGADYRVRIFTPGRELAFAGHPTLGSAHAWLEAGGVPHDPGRVVQQCGVGLVALRQAEALAFAAPPTTRSGPLDELLLRALADGLGVPHTAIIDHQWVVNGPNWLCVRLASGADVLALEPDFGALASLRADIGVIGFYPPDAPCRYETRAFALDAGVGEDPVTGSLNASVAQWLHRVGAVPDHYVVAQGARVGRAGRVHVDVDSHGTVWIGGGTVTRVRGSVDL